MDILFIILIFIGTLWLTLWGTKALIKGAANTPTWNGIIISAILGMLPMYLILCFFGIMGEPRSLRTVYIPQPPTGNYAEDMSRRHANYGSPRTGKWMICIALMGFFLILLFGFLSSRTEEREHIKQSEIIDVEQVIPENRIEQIEVPTPKSDTKTSKQKRKESQPSAAVEVPKTSATKRKTVKINNLEPSLPDSIATVNVNHNEEEKAILSTIELLERKNHENAVKQAKEAGVSAEGSTLDILERINHKNVVKQAKEAGVSAEGSTLDILERINHKNVVKQAKEAGVSTEGSTLDILERINHANVIKQARRMGVSTEGSTMDILERINRKTLEKYLE